METAIPMTDPILDTVEALGASARDKMKELWSKISGKTSSGPKNQSANQRAGGKYQALSTEDEDVFGDEADDEIGFDSSLTKRYTVADDEEDNEQPVPTTTTTTTSSSSTPSKGPNIVEMKPMGSSPQTPQQQPQENKKTL